VELGVGHWPDLIEDRRPERSQRMQRALAVFYAPAVARGDRDHFCAIGSREERAGSGHLIGRGVEEVAVESNHLRRARERVYDHAGDDRRANVVQLELEGSHHAEVAAAAAQPPKEVGVFHWAGPEQPPIRCYHIGSDEIVAR